MEGVSVKTKMYRAVRKSSSGFVAETQPKASLEEAVRFVDTQNKRWQHGVWIVESTDIEWVKCYPVASDPDFDDWYASVCNSSIEPYDEDYW